MPNHPTTGPDQAKAARVFAAMLEMTKLDIAAGRRRPPASRHTSRSRPGSGRDVPGAAARSLAPPDTALAGPTRTRPRR